MTTFSNPPIATASSLGMVCGTGNISIGVDGGLSFSLASMNSDNLAEGSINRYYSDSRVAPLLTRPVGEILFGATEALDSSSGFTYDINTGTLTVAGDDGALVILKAPTVTPTGSAPATSAIIFWDNTALRLSHRDEGGNTLSYSTPDDLADAIDTRVAKSGDTMAGPLEVPSGATGNQAISAADVDVKVRGAVGAVFNYRASTTVGGTPSSGNMQWGNATQALSPNVLSLSNLTDDGNDVYIFLQRIKSGSVILVQDRNDSDNFQEWETTSDGTDNTTYWTFPGTLTDSGGTGTTNFPNNHQLVIYASASAIPQNTDNLPEGPTNLYYTDTRVLAVADAWGSAAAAQSAAIAASASATLADGKIYVGDSGNVAVARTVSGDATLSNTGAITLATVVSASTVGSASAIPVITYDDKGRITSTSTAFPTYGARTVRTVSGTSDTPTAADSGQVVECNNAGTITVTLSNLLAGSDTLFVQVGAGKINFVSGTLTRKHVGSLFSTAGQDAVVSVLVNGAGTLARLSGDLTT